jgi:hypothetical protein
MRVGSCRDFFAQIRSYIGHKNYVNQLTRSINTISAAGRVLSSTAIYTLYMARTPSKPHIPYRGDDPTVGKKTGIQVARINRTSDGFEPFNDLLSQANGRTPPRRKKKRVSDEGEEEEDEEDDEYGEASMDVDSRLICFKCSFG